MRSMITLVRREFTVELPRAKAWQHLAHVEQWPSWAKHITRVHVEPAGELGAQSTGVIHLSNGIKSAFNMTQFSPHRNWMWTGSFLWLTIRYDHVFEELTHQQTKLIWIVEGEGFGVSVFGKLFAKLYSKNLDKAIPALVGEMNRQSGIPN